MSGPGQPLSSSVPVIVVGNITVGGTGKTPLVLRLAEALVDRGYSPGVASRGYGSSAGRGPVRVERDSLAEQVGDEPLLIHRRLGIPVVVGSNRPACVASLAESGCDVVISDDGLQHFRMHRDLEIVVTDGERGLGNRRMMPAGPLRDHPDRLEQVDWIVVNGQSDGAHIDMQLVGETAHRILDRGDKRPLSEFAGHTVHAVAGIGNPKRFFDQLREAGLTIQEHAHADHMAFAAEDFRAFAGETVLMTEKDAVKCIGLAEQDWWCLPVTARISDNFLGALVERLETLRQS